MQVNLAALSSRYVAPWDQEPAGQRATSLREAAGRRVAYLYAKADTSTFRYRAYNMVEALREAGDGRLAAAWFQLDELRHLQELLPQLSILVIVRVPFSPAVSDLVARARIAGVRVLFDCDDLVFDVSYTQLVSNALDQDGSDDGHWQTWFALFGRIQATAMLCDGGITTNAFLAERMARVVDGPVHVVPNFLNRRQERLSRALLARKQEQEFRDDGRITIGYFSGTPTHNLDFAIALPALLNLLARDPKVSLRIVGFMKSFERLAEFGRRVEVIPLQDWLNLQVKIAEVDINIAPLQQNEFTNCKSELKYFEAAAVGSWTVASPSFTMRQAISDPALARLTGDGDWAEALDDAVTLARDKAAYARNAALSARHAYDTYGWDRSLSAICSALAE